MNPKYPVYIPTKGRWESLHTINAMEKIGVPFRAVIEPQQYDNYAAVMDEKKLLVLPHSDKWLVVTRNWIWDHALESGVEKFWTFDDNIRSFYRLNRNQRIYLNTGSFLNAIEDFVDRYENVPIAGMHYKMFAPDRQKRPVFLLNTRVYSNMLIQTDAKDPYGKPYRNEGFYNDDTDLCLRILKDGFCTILFYVFLVDKIATMTVKGGMTPHYQDDGRWKMAKELQEKHPDVTRITRKWGRWQHHVDYSQFRFNRLIKKPDIAIPDEPNEYGMKLVHLDEKK